jgi:hypothetical protein
VAALEADFFGLAYLLLMNEEVLGNGYFQGIVYEWLEHYASGSVAGKDFIVGHLSRCSENEDWDLRPRGANPGKQSLGFCNAIPGKENQAGPVHGFEVAEEGQLFREEAQVIQGGKRPLQIAEDPEIGFKHEEAGP